MNAMDEKRKSIIRKIKGLKEKTLENGCSEEEVIEASRIVGQLLDRYNLTMTDVELGSLHCIERLIMTESKRNEPPIGYCMQALADYCDVSLWKTQKFVRFPKTGYEKRLHYVLFGLEHDVDVAEYLYHVINSAIEREYSSYKEGSYYNSLRNKGDKKVATNNFKRGLAHRVETRLYLMKSKRQEEVKESTGRDLIPIKHDLVQKEKSLLGYKFTKGKPRYHYSDFNAYRSGVKAGDNVSLNPGLKGAKKSQLLS